MVTVKGRWQANAIRRITNVDFVPTKSRDVMKKLMQIFKNHIGEEDKITTEKLFEKVYKSSPQDVTDLQYFLLQTQISVAISRMRQETNCFIVRNGSFLWVAKTYDDAHLFKRQVAERVKGLVTAAQRCDTAVKYRWYKDEFAFTKHAITRKAEDLNLIEGFVPG